MTEIAVRRIVGYAHVASVPRSIEFYAHLGFTVRNTVAMDGGSEPTWAYLESGAAHLMLARSSGPVIASEQAVLFYLYFDDVLPVHAELIRRGLAVGVVTFPFYCPRGEFRMEDPDGYTLMITHT